MTILIGTFQNLVLSVFFQVLPQLPNVTSNLDTFRKDKINEINELHLISALISKKYNFLNFSLHLKERHFENEL